MVKRDGSKNNQTNKITNPNLKNDKKIKIKERFKNQKQTSV